MIKTLRLRNFKNFQDATLALGSLTVLIGANASGKSNVRDAFRFLHGIGRGYSLAEILGEAYVGGVRVWNGIRGGTREVASEGSQSFQLEVKLDIPNVLATRSQLALFNYLVEVLPGKTTEDQPRIANEVFGTQDRYLLKYGRLIDQNNTQYLIAKDPKSSKGHPSRRIYNSTTPAVFQVSSDAEVKSISVLLFAKMFMRSLGAFRFLDLSPTQMRIPSLPGQTILGDRGENLFSVLLAICVDATKKAVLLEWVRKLTPMDVDDLLFDQDAAGKVLLHLREKNGATVSALSASDGTLRFLAILAALLGPNPASFYFIEELENGIHPTRLGLLIDLIEHQTRRRDIQVVATSHSPLLLQFLSEDSLANASIIYRLPDHPDAKIKRLLDIPEARRVIKEQGVSLLHASSWFEDVLGFMDHEEEQPSAPIRGTKR